MTSQTIENILSNAKTTHEALATSRLVVTDDATRTVSSPNSDVTLVDSILSQVYLSDYVRRLICCSYDGKVY